MIGRTHQHVPVTEARRLFMHSTAMLDAAAPPGQTLRTLLARLGFVQLDSINIVERAHHHILWTRWPEYRPGLLDSLYSSRTAFEHWTHDASLIPVEFFPHWRWRFERYREPGAWMRERLGPRHKRIIAEVLRRIAEEGPLMARDFAEAPAPRKNGAAAGWWNWNPCKAALEYLWRTGELAIARRVNFHKVYDLTQRIYPEASRAPAPPRREHIDWACSAAMDRLGIATPRQIAAFWNATTLEEARTWCAAAVHNGRLVPITIDGIAGAGAPSQRAFAIAEFRERLAALPEPSSEIRLLSPFDPLIRDRQRTLRLFGFEYRFEAFTPASRRRFGYYVLPILEQDRLIGRLDPSLDRDSARLRARVWFEPGIRATRLRTRILERAVASYAQFNGASTWEFMFPAPARA